MKKNKKNSKLIKVLKVIGWVLVVFAAIGFWTGIYYLGTLVDKSDDFDFYESDYYEDCNVGRVKLFGNLFTYSSQDENGTSDYVSADYIMDILDQIESDDEIKAFILEIDSYGGGPVAGEEVAKALKNFDKPSIAMIHEAGLSAAYYAATGADQIFASRISDVGSIGITMSYIDYSQQNELNGIVYNQLSSGKFKDAGDYDKPLTDEEREIFMRDILKIHDIFVEDVALNRNLPIENVKAISDGSSMLGEDALEQGLIDQIGGRQEVKAYLENLIGEDIQICEW